MSKLDDARKKGMNTLIALAIIAVAVYIGFTPLYKLIGGGVAGAVIFTGFPVPVWITPGPKICAESWVPIPRTTRRLTRFNMEKSYACARLWQQNSMSVRKFAYCFSLVMLLLAR